MLTNEGRPATEGTPETVETQVTKETSTAVETAAIAQNLASRHPWDETTALRKIATTGPVSAQ